MEILMKGVPSYLFVIFSMTHLLKPQTTEYITKLSPVPARLVLAASTPKLSFCCLPKSTDTKNFLFCCQPKPTDAKKISLCCTSLQYNREGGRNACSELGCPSLWIKMLFQWPSNLRPWNPHSEPVPTTFFCVCYIPASAHRHKGRKVLLGEAQPPPHQIPTQHRSSPCWKCLRWRKQTMLSNGDIAYSPLKDLRVDSKHNQEDKEIGTGTRTYNIVVFLG